jgi:small multidrug resistance pump|tara:strand:- start:370 stop:705 length:336 start_codon:yes stop_codon:yes gene_type:complete
MTIFSGYVYLFIGIVAGISANSFAKISNGFSELYPTISCILLMFICMFSLSKAMTVIPVGFTYATYGGLTITAIAIFGIIKYDQIPNLYGVIGISLIIIGVILLNTLGKTT